MRLRNFLPVLALACLTPSAAPACSIPVFRYALERWQPAPCTAYVFHRGPLTAADRQALALLDGPPTAANLSLTVTDLTGLPLGSLQPQPGEPPLLVVRTAQAAPDDPHSWQGPLTQDNVRLLLDSPARRRLVERLTGGDAVVFVLLESGDAEADRRAADLLARELPRLEKETKLPTPTEDGPQLRTKLPLRASFPVLRLSRRDAAEAGFVRLLLGSEDGLPGERGPVVFPVFGRGRVLCGLRGDDLRAEQLGRVVRFLCGACSCQVKELNPGSDLLVSADWDALLAPAEDGKTGAPLMASRERQRPEGKAPVADAPGSPSAAPRGGSPSGTNPPATGDLMVRRALEAAAATAAAGVLVSGILLWRGRGKKPADTPGEASP